MPKAASILAVLLTTTALATPSAALAKKMPASPSTEEVLSNADKDMKKVLDAQASLGPKPVETLSPEEARKQPTPSDGVKKLLAEDGKDPNDPLGVKTKNVTYASGGAEIPARIYMPEDFDGKEPLPVIVYYHGGGWVIADLDVYDSTPRGLAKSVNAIVVSAHYRQAPENKFPAAHDDAFAAYEWVLKNAASWGGDPSRIAVMGESAGGNLAINTAIKARDEHVQMPLHQVLIYPVAGVDMLTPSYIENANAKPLNKGMMQWFIKHTIKAPKDKLDPRLDLIGKADLAGLPPTTIVTAELDPLRSDSEKLLTKLRNANVKVDYKNYDGVTHEFFGMALVVDDAKAANVAVTDNLKDALKKSEAQPEPTEQPSH